MMRVLLLAAVLGSSMLPSRATAQEPARNPHGPLREACATCHQANAWVPARISREFNHAATGFALAGAHAQTSCRSCHANLAFSGVDRACAACHADVHRGELGADCARCHTPRGFLDRSAMTRAHQATRFPLTGSHLVADCESCHTPAPQGQFTFVNHPTECVACHARDYAAARDPNHQALNFPETCEQCHATTTWPAARFTHATTRFPLTGAHLTTPCNRCHANGVYRGLDVTCVGCHQTDYQNTTNPNHQAAGFPTDCASCHTTSRWDGASFDHDARFFPIYSGTHRGTWSSCATCHTSATNYSQFTCLVCHAHDQTIMDQQHQGRTGYRYDSQACYSCHPRGNN